MAGIRGSSQLLRQIGDHGAIKRVQSGAPAGRQDIAELADDVGPARHIGGVVEDRNRRARQYGSWAVVLGHRLGSRGSQRPRQGGEIRGDGSSWPSDFRAGSARSLSWPRDVSTIVVGLLHRAEIGNIAFQAAEQPSIARTLLPEVRLHSHRRSAK